mgnify:FL=1
MNEFGLALLAYCVYLAAVLSAFVGDPELSRRLLQATWWGVPVAIAAWGWVALSIASKTAQSGEGAPANAGWAAQLRSQWAEHQPIYRPIANLSLWGTAAILAVLGSIPNVAWTMSNEQEAIPWTGRAYSTQALYWVCVAWAVVVFSVAALALYASYQARPAGMSVSEENRSRYFAIAGVVLLVLYLMLGVGVASGIWSEPLLNLALSLVVASVVFELAHANAVARSPLKTARPRNLVLWAIGCTTVAAVLAVDLGRSLERAAIAAPVIAGGLAFLRPRINLYRRQATTEESASESGLPALSHQTRTALRRVMAAGTSGGLETPGAEVLRSTLGQLDILRGDVPADPGQRFQPLSRLLSALPDADMKRRAKAVTSVSLNKFVDGFLPLEGIEHEVRLRSLTVLVRVTATNERRRLDEAQTYRGVLPTPLHAVEVECNARNPESNQQPEQRSDRLRRRFFKKGAIRFWDDSIEPVPTTSISDQVKEQNAATWLRRTDKGSRMIVNEIWPRHLERALGELESFTSTLDSNALESKVHE